MQRFALHPQHGQLFRILSKERTKRVWEEGRGLCGPQGREEFSETPVSAAYRRDRDEEDMQEGYGAIGCL